MVLIDLKLFVLLLRLRDGVWRHVQFDIRMLNEGLGEFDTAGKLLGQYSRCTVKGTDIPLNLHHLLSDLRPASVTSDNEIKRNLVDVRLPLSSRLTLPLFALLSWLTALLGLCVRHVPTPVDTVKLGLEAELHAVGIGGKSLYEAEIEERPR